MLSILYLLLSLTILNCNVEELKPKVVFKTRLDKKTLNYPKRNGVYYEIPAKAGLYKDTAILAEPSERSIKIFEKNILKIVIRSKAFYAEDKKTNISLPPDVVEIHSELLHVPGSIIVDSDENFFVLNYKPNTDSNDKKKTSVGEGEYSILGYSLSGKFINKLQPRLEEKLAFEQILWFDIDEKERLWVLFKNEDTIYLDAYRDGKNIYRITEDECRLLILKGVELSDELVYSCELMFPFYDGEKVLLVGRVERLEQGDKEDSSEERHSVLESRIYKFINRSSKAVSLVFQRDASPEISPNLPYGDNEFIIWETKDYHHFRLRLYNLEAELKQTLDIQLMGFPHSWRNTYTTLEGKIYSLKIAEESLFLYLWN